MASLVHAADGARPAAGAGRDTDAAVAVVMMLAQLLRRAYECLAVARFSRGARQPAIVAAASVTYYVAAAATPLVDSSLWQERRGGGLFDALGARHAAALAVFAAAWWAQSVAHRQLAELRSPGRPAYSIPRGALFRRVSMPHYLAEIVMYAAVAGAARGRASQLLVLSWVAANLSVTAARSHAWYLGRFPAYAALGRARLVPFVW